MKGLAPCTMKKILPKDPLFKPSFSSAQSCIETQLITHPSLAAAMKEHQKNMKKCIFYH